MLQYAITVFQVVPGSHVPGISAVYENHASEWLPFSQATSLRILYENRFTTDQTHLGRRGHLSKLDDNPLQSVNSAHFFYTWFERRTENSKSALPKNTTQCPKPAFSGSTQRDVKGKFALHANVS